MKKCDQRYFIASVVVEQKRNSGTTTINVLAKPPFRGALPDWQMNFN